MSELGNEPELGLNNEGEGGMDAQLRFNIQNRREATAQDVNRAQPRSNRQERRQAPIRRMSVLQLALLVISTSWTSISDLSLSRLAGFQVFVLYGSLFTGLVLFVVAALPRSIVSAPTITKIARISASLVLISLALKMKLPAQS